MKVLQILQFLGLMAEKIMFWKQANNAASKNEKKRKQAMQNKFYMGIITLLALF